MESLKKLSVIIVTYNCLEQIIDCIDSIIKYNDIGEELEIIVVDNSPDDEIFHYLKKEYPNVITIKSKNDGFGAGNNKGYRISQGEYLLFLNPDTILVEPIFKYSISKFKTDDSLGIFGVQLVDRNMKENSSFDIRMCYGILNKILIKVCRKFQIFLPSIMYPSGADLFIRRSDFSDCGMFDDKLFLYGEESDICYRINNLGKAVGYFKEKKIIHLQGQSTGSNFGKKFKLMLNSEKYLCEKHDLNYLNLVKREIRYFRFKKMVSRKEDNVLVDKIIEILDSEIKTTKHKFGL
jgi:GT2 family glycosyltransferase